MVLLVRGRQQPRARGVSLGAVLFGLVFSFVCLFPTFGALGASFQVLVDRRSSFRASFRCVLYGCMFYHAFTVPIFFSS